MFGGTASCSSPQRSQTRVRRAVQEENCSETPRPDSTSGRERNRRASDFSWRETDPPRSYSPLAMHLVLITVGTEGDVRPFVALGVGLRSAGYRITIATHTDFQGLITSHGLGFRAIGGSF